MAQDFWVLFVLAFVLISLAKVILVIFGLRGQFLWLGWVDAIPSLVIIL